MTTKLSQLHSNSKNNMSTPGNIIKWGICGVCTLALTVAKTSSDYNCFAIFVRLPVTWLNTIWLNFFVESFGLKILSQVTTKLSQLHSNSRNKYVNSRKYQNAWHMRCMHARPHRRKDQLPLRSLRDLRSR